MPGPATRPVWTTSLPGRRGCPGSMSSMKVALLAWLPFCQNDQFLNGTTVGQSFGPDVPSRASHHWTSTMRKASSNVALSSSSAS